MGNFSDICDNLKKLADELHSTDMLKKLGKKLGIIKRIQYVTHLTRNMC